MREFSDFEISVTLGLVLRANADVLQDLLNHIRDHHEIFIVYKKTSAGKLTIVDGD